MDILATIIYPISSLPFDSLESGCTTRINWVRPINEFILSNGLWAGKEEFYSNPK